MGGSDGSLPRSLSKRMWLRHGFYCSALLLTCPAEPLRSANYAIDPGATPTAVITDITAHKAAFCIRDEVAIPSRCPFAQRAALPHTFNFDCGACLHLWL